jgi:hypothetical protein
LLDGMGLTERLAPPPPTWTSTRASLPPAPELMTALTSAASRLGLILAANAIRLEGSP